MSRSYSDRVIRFRKRVYGRRTIERANGETLTLTAGCRVLLLRLSDDMSAKAIVSVPRSKLAKEFDVAPARITEWIALARALGFLDVVRRARPGVTAVYQGLIPEPEVRQDVPLEVRQNVPSQRYGKPDVTEVRQDVPQNDAQRYARAVPQEVERNGTSAPYSTCATNSSSKEEPPCYECDGHGCPDCATSERRAAS